MLIIDAYNALHATGALPSHLAGIELEGLSRLIRASRYAARPALLVCDGTPRSEALTRASTDRRFPGQYTIHECRILFAGAGKDADSLIERLLTQDSAPARLLVVSTDRRVRKAASRRGAQSITSGEFLSQLAADEARPRPEAYPAFAQEIPLDPYSLALWMREFGFEPEPPARPSSLPKPETAKPKTDKPKTDGHAQAAPPKSNPPAASSAPHAPKPALPVNTDPVLADPHISDPLLLEALRHWDGRLRADELDMRRWLEKEIWLNEENRNKRP